ncbi:MAG: MarR family transcriptional regulator [Spirochaetia bacterium]|nr:MarR family transcriptional regulator [Spirochaetia bacterium]
MEDTMKLLQTAAKALKCEIRVRVSGAGITQAQWSVLNELKCAGRHGTNTAAEIAQALHMDKPTISGVIKRLEKSGWINSVRDPKDARSKRLELTSKAVKTMKNSACCGKDTAQKAFKGFSVAESERLKIYLNRIINNMEDK